MFEHHLHLLHIFAPIIQHFFCRYGKEQAILRNVFIAYYDFCYRTWPYANPCSTVAKVPSDDLICPLLEIQESEIQRDFWTLRMLLKSSSQRVCYFVVECSMIRLRSLGKIICGDSHCLSKFSLSPVQNETEICYLVRLIVNWRANLNFAKCGSICKLWTKCAQRLVV